MPFSFFNVFPIFFDQEEAFQLGGWPFLLQPQQRKVLPHTQNNASCSFSRSLSFVKVSLVHYLHLHLSLIAFTPSFLSTVVAIYFYSFYSTSLDIVIRLNEPFFSSVPCFYTHNA